MKLTPISCWLIGRFTGLRCDNSKNDDARWQLAAHQDNSEVSGTKLCTCSTRKYGCLFYKKLKDWNYGWFTVATEAFGRFVDPKLNWNTSSVNVTTSLQTCALWTTSFVGLLPPATANLQLWRSTRYWKHFKVKFQAIDKSWVIWKWQVSTLFTPPPPKSVYERYVHYDTVT